MNFFKILLTITLLPLSINATKTTFRWRDENGKINPHFHHNIQDDLKHGPALCIMGLGTIVGTVSVLRGCRGLGRLTEGILEGSKTKTSQGIGQIVGATAGVTVAGVGINYSDRVARPYVPTEPIATKK
jgi:hypothetical protein